MAEQQTQAEQSVAPVARPDSLLRLPEVIKRSGLERSAIYARMAKGAFPRSIPLGGRIVAWSANEISEWVEACKADRAA